MIQSVTHIKNCVIQSVARTVHVLGIKRIFSANACLRAINYKKKTTGLVNLPPDNRSSPMGQPR
jgi:hypothetical protein